MYVPVTWLRDLVAVDPSATGHDIAASLVKVGLEEEGITGGEVTGPLVVGRVLSATPEPQKNGKTINWCQVDVGAANGTGEPQGIVCGAHNFGAGDLVAVILPGGVLPGGFEISARKTYGHVSAGMICSERELGLGDDHSGIIVLTRLLADRPEVLSSLAPGDDLIPVLGLDAEVLEVNVTPDRGYCFSMRGIAREYALATGVAYDDPAGIPIATGEGEGYAIRLADEAPLDGVTGCDRYVARVVRGVDATASSPSWMQERLRDMGMRPISLAVDVTNYVMLLLGQPLHAFDLQTLSGSVVVRRARHGERLTTLDDVERTLDPQDLLITDGGTVPLALAGVMGGATSEVSSSTSDVLIEAAHFDPVTVARTSRRHRLSTEASKRFERGVDPDLAPVAAQLAVDLLVEHGGGVADPAVTDVDRRHPRHAFPFDLTLPTRLVGLEYPRSEVLATLRAIGCAVEEGDGDTVSVLPPSWRPDLTDGPELVEEVARVRGYDQIPSVVAVHGGRGLTHSQRSRRLVANTLAGQGLYEVQTFPFVSEGLFGLLGYADDDARRRTVRVTNPLSEEAPLMRTSVLDTLIDALRRNVARGTRDVAVYEVARVVAGLGAGAAPVVGIERRPDDETLEAILASVPPQPFHLGFAAAGDAVRSGPWGPSRRYDATDAVAWAREVGRALGIELSVRAAGRAPWHPGRCAAVALPDGTVVGHVGELHPKVVAALDLPERTVAGELDLDVIVAATSDPVQAHRLSTYPQATTDVALVVDDDVPAAAVEAGLREGSGDDLEALVLFDVYRGDQVGSGRKSLAYRLVFRAPDRTLRTEEVNALRDRAVAAAAEGTGATQRRS